MLPSIESLRCFAAAAKLLNFRAASRSCGLTPAAFGQRIKQLEEQLGTALFTRTTRSVQLTQAGLSLVPLAERCLQAAADCTRVGDADAAMAPMDLVVGTRHELGLSWLLPEVDALSRALPYVQLHLYVGSGPDLLLRVRSMAIDCAITSSLITDSKLDSLRLHREDYVLVGAPRLLDREPLSKPAHAAAHTLIDIEVSTPLFRYLREAHAEGQGMRFARVVSMGTIEAIRQRVLAGAGVAVLPAYLVQGDLRRKHLRRLLPKQPVLHDYFRLVFRGDDPRRSIFDSLAAHLMRVPLR